MSESIIITGDNRRVDLPSHDYALVYCDPPYGTGNTNLGYPDPAGKPWDENFPVFMKRLVGLKSKFCCVSISHRRRFDVESIMRGMFSRVELCAVRKRNINTSGVHHCCEYLLIGSDESAYRKLPSVDLPAPEKICIGMLEAIGDRADRIFPITIGEKTAVPKPGMYWTMSRSLVDREIASGELVFLGNQLRRVKTRTAKRHIIPAIIEKEITGFNRNGNEKQEMLGTGKPFAYMRWMVDVFTQPGDWVLDPYAGTGTMRRVCEELGRNYVGIEIGAK